VFGQGVNCEYLRSYSDFLSTVPPTFGTIREFNASQAADQREIRRSAKLFFEAYRKGERPGPVTECGAVLPASVRERFATWLPTVALDESLEVLRKSDSSVARDLAETILGRRRNGTWSPLRLVGHYASPNPTGEKAGYHRSSGSIFMDFDRIDSNEWLIVLAHELSHSVDVRLRSALPVYNDRVRVEKVAALARARSNPKRLSRDDHQLLETWVVAGLDRGYFAEARAWAMTARLYVDGLPAGLWAPIEWMDGLIEGKIATETWEAHFLRKLEEGFDDPEEGIFELPLVRRKIRDTRRAAASGRLDIGAIELDGSGSTH
jgi:hypothetical protein